MPEKATVERAQADLRAGKSPTTAIGLSKARRAGIPLKPPTKSQAKKSTRKSVASRSALSRHAKSVARRRKRA
jgi:hypothetical protein